MNDDNLTKATEVLVRLGFSDVVVTKEDCENGEYEKPDSYIVGYEDKKGNECSEDGTYLNQTWTHKDKETGLQKINQYPS